jgi:hypothetical protein
VVASGTCPDTRRSVRLLVRAPVVVSSCGALHTPALLLRSGVTCGGAVGRNLRLHPASVLVARFPRGMGAAAGAPAAGAGLGAAAAAAAARGEGSEEKVCEAGPGGAAGCGGAPGQQGGGSEAAAGEHSDGSWEDVAAGPDGAASASAAGTGVAGQQGPGSGGGQLQGEQRGEQQGQQQAGYGPEHFVPLARRGQLAVDMWSGAMMTVFSRFKVRGRGLQALQLRRLLLGGVLAGTAQPRSCRHSRRPCTPPRRPPGTAAATGPCFPSPS